MNKFLLLASLLVSPFTSASELVRKCDFEIQTPTGELYLINGKNIAFIKSSVDGYTVKLLSGEQLKTFVLKKHCPQ